MPIVEIGRAFCQSSENATSKIDKLTNWNLPLSDIDTSISEASLSKHKNCSSPRVIGNISHRETATLIRYRQITKVHRNVCVIICDRWKQKFALLRAKWISSWIKFGIFCSNFHRYIVSLSNHQCLRMFKIVSRFNFDGSIFFVSLFSFQTNRNPKWKFTKIRSTRYIYYTLDYELRNIGWL